MIGLYINLHHFMNLQEEYEAKEKREKVFEVKLEANAHTNGQVLNIRTTLA